MDRAANREADTLPVSRYARLWKVARVDHPCETPLTAATWLVCRLRFLVPSPRDAFLPKGGMRVIRQVEQARASHALAKSQSRMTVLCEIFITSAVSSTLNPPK